MTPLPKRRWSTHRQGRKRANFKPTSLTGERCPHCGGLKPIHVACPSCGFYKDIVVIKIKTKEKKGENQK